MNTVTKPEWLQLHSPTPQASEPVAWMHGTPGRFEIIHAEVKKLWERVGQPAQFAKEIVSCKVENYTIPLYDHVKPCERCAELETRLHKLAIDWQVQQEKLAALEAENARLTNAASPLLQTMEVNAWRAVVTGLCLRFPDSPEDAREQIKGRMQEQDKARKQAQADLETYKGRCTDLEHQNERLEAENARLTRVIRQQAEASAVILKEKQSTIAQLNKQLAAAQKDAERYRWIFDNCEIRAEQETQLDRFIAAQKEGK